jgi:arginase family enzyme
MRAGSAAIPFTRAPVWPGRISPSRFAATIRRDSPKDCAVGLLGLPDDSGVTLNGGRWGARRGPAAFRAVLSNYGSADGADAPWPVVFDAGDIQPGRSLDETHQRVTEATGALLERGLLPIAVGGGHDLTFAWVRAVAARFPGIVGLYFDAHLDVRETAGSGMAFRRLVEKCGVKQLHLHGYRPLVNTREHLAWFRAHGGSCHPDHASVKLPRGKNLFVSFDLDVLDASHVAGVSAMNPAGWSVAEAVPWVRACGADRRVRCFDLMELNPRFDPDRRSARVAAHLFLTFLAGMSER